MDLCIFIFLGKKKTKFTVQEVATMHFKPKIFISSVLTLSEIRSKIEELLVSSGSEPILYEVNLTPSISNATYRQDILDSDFVIFIFDEKYGTSTENGISGTHEEWDIISTASIPRHVYVKKSDTRDEKLNELISKGIKTNNVSYYYYKDENDLLIRIKSSIFTIAKEIALNKLSKHRVSKDTVLQLAFESDYADALHFINGFEDILEMERTTVIGFVETNILKEYFMFWRYYYSSYGRVFIDNEFNKLFREILQAVDEHYDYHANNSVAKGHFSVTLNRIQYVLTVSHVELFENFDHSLFNKYTENILNSYFKFKEQIFLQKQMFETRKRLMGINNA